MNISRYLEDIEGRINPDIEENLNRQWIEFADGKLDKGIFNPSRSCSKTEVTWDKVLINDAFEDVDLMIYSQLKGVSDILEKGEGTLLNVRANYGTGIIPSMFGCEIFKLNDEADTLPGTRPLEDGRDGVVKILENPVIDYSKGLAPRVFEFAERYKEYIKDYPKIQKYVHVYNPDLQGPFPICDMIWGSDIYLEFYEEEPILEQMEELMANVIIDFAKKWQAIFPAFDSEHSLEWGLLHKGLILLRNDSAVNISPAQYDTWIKKYEQKVLDEFGGGIHFCGKCDHVIPNFTSLDNMYCINMSQPHLNDMEKIYKHTVDKGIQIIGMPSTECERVLREGRELHGNVHCGASLAAYEIKK